MSDFSLTSHREFVARDWSEKRQIDKGDCVTEGSALICPEGRKIGLIPNDVERLKSIWFRKFTKEQRFVFRQKFGYIAELLNVTVEPALLSAALEFWDPSYRCFSFKTIDLAPTYEEYCQILGTYPSFPIKMHMGTGGDFKKVEIILYRLISIGREISQNHFSVQRNRKILNIGFIWPYVENHLSEENGMRTFALLIYGLILFPTVRNGIDVNVIYFFEKVIEATVNPVPTILAETYRSLNFCRKNVNGKFHACVPLLSLWLRSHFESTVIPRPKGLYRDYSKKPEGGTSSEPKDVRYWLAYLHELEKKDLRWISEFGTAKNVLWRCKDLGYLPLPGVWGVIGYTPLMVLRQFGITQFVPATDFLRDEGFEYTDPKSTEKIRTIMDAWKRLDCIVIDGEESTESTDKYEYWTSRRIRDVAALKDWVVNSGVHQPPEKEEKVVEKYRKLLNRKMGDFNDLMGKMQSELESHKWIMETQEEKIELAEKGKRKAIQEREEVRECNAQLNDTLRKLQRFMLIRMVKVTDMEEAMDKVRAKCAVELEQEKKEFAHHKRIHEKDKQEWVEGIQNRESQILELKRQIQKLQRTSQDGGEWRLKYEELRDRVDRDQDSQVSELKEQVRQQNLQIQGLQKAKQEGDEEYEEHRDRMDQQLAAAAREIQGRKEQIEQLRSDFESLEMAYQRNERELIQRRAEACRIRQEYASQAKEWVSQWGSVSKGYEERIRDMTTRIDMAIKTAAKVYALIKDYREDALRGCKGLPSLPDFLSDILMLSAEIEKFVIHI